MAELFCHPALLFEDFLETFFNTLPFEELKTCRGVCRQWEALTRDLVRNQSQLRLNGDIQRNLALEKFLRRDAHFLLPPSKLKIEIMEPETTVPKSTLRGRALRNYLNECDKRVQKGVRDLCEILGLHSFQELQICQIKYEDPAASKTSIGLLNTIGRLSTSVKSLWTSFILKHASTNKKFPDNCSLITKISIGCDSEWFQPFQNRIFPFCPNLTEINGNYKCFLTVLENTSGGLTKLRGFSCSIHKDLEMLRRKSGNLEELSLEVRDDMGVSVLKFVHSKKESLRILQLKFPCEHPKTIRLEGFSLLTKLHLEKERHAPMKQILLDIRFARDTPQLKYFKMEFYSRQEWQDVLAYRSNIWYDGRVIPQRTLTHLDLRVQGLVLDDRECANYLRMLFPSLSSLKIKRSTEDFLRGVWQMENLVEIHINMWTPYQDIEDLGAVLFGNPEDQEDEETIFNLKKLRSLCIIKRIWNIHSSSSWIPDEVVRNGFGNMKLTALNLPRFNMTPEAVGFLRANLPYLRDLTVAPDAYVPTRMICDTYAGTRMLATRITHMLCDPYAF